MRPRPLPRIILIDAEAAQRAVLARLLRAQGYEVEPFGDAAAGADMALRRPPAAVIADLWMPSISGVQICRLLRSEPFTADVPVVLTGRTDDPKSRFWAEKAGAAAYVADGSTTELVRALANAVCSRSRNRFLRLGEGNLDIRDRIARHLDAALFESVIAAEVRALACEGSFERLFESLSRLLSRLTTYRWMAACTLEPPHFGIHSGPGSEAVARAEAGRALSISADTAAFVVRGRDDFDAEEQTVAVACSVVFGTDDVGRVALSVPRTHENDATILLRLVARELGGPIRMTGLVEESRLQASIDPLTGLMNRRAFQQLIEGELSRCERYDYSLSLILLDLDDFKLVNDRRGHGAGDLVLTKIGATLRDALRKSDCGVRWGGEEFVLALPSTDLAGACSVAERLRGEIEHLEVFDAAGERLPVTASIGVASRRPGESFELLVGRADHAMYAAKSAGRNRVVVDGWPPPPAHERPEDPDGGARPWCAGSPAHA